MITGDDRERGERGCRGRHGNVISFPDKRSSTWGQLERGDSSSSPYDTASEEDNRA